MCSRYLLQLVFATLLLALASCSSSKNAVSSTAGGEDIYAPSTYDYLSERLGIKITKKDKEHISLFETSARWIGTPYKYGGASRNGCDCSGLVGQIFRSVYGKNLERNSAKIEENNCRRISKNNLRTGDLVFFATGKKHKINHVGIYLKDNKVIHASSSKGVIVSNLESDYYRRTFVSAGRVK